MRMCWCERTTPPTHLLRQPLRQAALARLQILLLSRHGRQDLRLPRRKLRLGGRALCAKPWVWHVSKKVKPHLFFWEPPHTTIQKLHPHNYKHGTYRLPQRPLLRRPARTPLLLLPLHPPAVLGPRRLEFPAASLQRLLLARERGALLH